MKSQLKRRSIFLAFMVLTSIPLHASLGRNLWRACTFAGAAIGACAVACRDTLLASTQQLGPAPVMHKEGNLIGVHRDNNGVLISRHERFDKKRYADLVQFCALSDAALGADIEKGEQQERVRKYKIGLRSALEEKGYQPLIRLRGKTGARNQTDDTTGIVSHHPDDRVIVVAFHGSYRGNRNPIRHDGEGDWGANYASKEVDAREIGLRDVPVGLKVHQGFARNFVSAQDELIEAIEGILSRLDEESLSDTWIYVTGHSKGAAIAALGALVTKGYLNKTGRQKVHVGLLMFSGPRVYYGKDSRQLVHSVLDKNNVIRVQSSWDIVPSVPLRAWGYHDVGLLAMDDSVSLCQRAKRNKGQDVSGILSRASWFACHYLSRQEELDGFYVDPQLVPSYGELADCLQRYFLRKLAATHT